MSSRNPGRSILLPSQETVTRALQSFVVAARLSDGAAMLANVAVVRAGTEQQMQRAMRTVQHARSMDRRDLLTLLAG